MGISRHDIVSALHFKGATRETKFRYDLLNKFDIKIGELDFATGGNISFNSDANIKKIGSFKIRENESRDIDWLNDRIKPYFCIKVNGVWLEYSLGIFIVSTPRKEKKGSYFYRSMDAYDSTVILTEDKFLVRQVFNKDRYYTDVINDIINTAGIWKINIPASPLKLGMAKEFEMGTSKLDAVNSLLKELNYTSLWVDNNGALTASPYQFPVTRTAEYVYANDDLSIITPDDSAEELDLFNVPNIWVITASNPEKLPLSSRYVNSARDSITSTVNRGRNIVHVENIDDIADQATLNNFTSRRAYDTSNVYSTFTFNTALMPHHTFEDCLFISHSEYDINAKYIEKSWSMDLALGGKMTHNCKKVIQI